MLKHLIFLMLACLLLCGCARPAQSEEPVPTAPHTSAKLPVSYYDAGSKVEQRTRGAVRAYPLDAADYTGLEIFGGSVLLFSGEETTTLTLIDQTGCISAKTDLGIWLAPDDPSLQIGPDNLSFFDYLRNETVVLDPTLAALSRIRVPGDLMGTPVLSADQTQLYYCTPTALRAMELGTGICRCIREMAHGNQSVSALIMVDSIIACSLSDDGGSHMAYISAETGRLLQESPEIALKTEGGRYYASFPAGMTQTLLFGTGEDAPTALTPADLTARCTFLESANAAVSVSLRSGNQVRFDYYDLPSGLRTASVTLDGQQPIALTDMDGYVYILMPSSQYGRDTLYRWDVKRTPLQDSTLYTGPYFNADAPDLAGLARCEDMAEEIGQRYGIRVLTWKHAAAAAPWDYDFEAEYLVPVIEAALTELDQLLGQFPREMLTSTAANFDGLTICLVRQLEGGLSAVSGLQYVLGQETYIALAAGPEMEKAFFHELYHVMETQIFNRSIALDQWEALNPKDFSYDLDYQKNISRDGSDYLRDETRAFIDTYAMSYPKEDRARIMEYACTPGNEGFFRSEPMQAKLRTLCEGIREAYNLEGSTECFLWEQYLYVPLT